MKTLQLCFLVVLSAFAGNAAAQTKDWVTVVGGGTSFDLVRGGDGKLSTRIPLQPAPAASVPRGTKLVAQTVDVSNKLGRASRLFASVRTTFEGATPTEGAGLLVVADLVPELLPGPMGLSVRIGPEPSSPKHPPQQTSLTLNVPAPELRAQPLAVDVVRPMPFVGTQSVVAKPLTIDERSRKAPVRGIEMDVLRDAASPPGPDSGVLSFAPPFGALAPGGAASAAVVVSGKYPLGKTAGKLEFRSQDLQAPLSVPYEVRVIESKGWIPLLAFVGVLLGYGFRTILKAHQEYKASLASASEFIASMARASATSLDDDYRRELQNIRQELDVATTGKKKAAIVISAIASAQPKLANTKTALDTRLTALLPRVQELRNFVDVAWRTPGRILSPLDDLRKEAFLLEQDMLARNAGKADGRLQEASKQGLPGVVNAAVSYGKAFALVATRLAESKLPLSEASQRRLVDAAALLAKSFPSSMTEVPKATVAVATEYLTKVYGDISLARTVIELLCADALAYVEWARKQVQAPESTVSLQSLVGSTKSSLDAKLLLADVEELSRDVGRLDQSIEGLRSAWAQFCRAVVPTLTEAEVQELIASGGWSKLVALAVQKRVSAGVGVELDKTRAPKVIVQGEPSSSTLELPSSVPQWSSSTVRTGTAGLDGSELEVYRLNRENVLLAAAQSIVVALLFVLGASFLYADDWVGRPKEMLTLLLLAFGVDLTADGLVAALKK